MKLSLVPETSFMKWEIKSDSRCTPAVNETWPEWTRFPPMYSRTCRGLGCWATFLNTDLYLCYGTTKFSLSLPACTPACPNWTTVTVLVQISISRERARALTHRHTYIHTYTHTITPLCCVRRVSQNLIYSLNKHYMSSLSGEISDALARQFHAH